MHPNGQLPAYEWDFDDVNPPVHAFAALQVFLNDGGTDYTWLERIFHKMLLGSPGGPRQGSGRRSPVRRGFLGMDNVGPFDRSAAQPPG